MRRTSVRTLAGTLVAVSVFALAPSGASADFHLIKVREVFPSATNGDFVELQMYAPGQVNLDDGHEIDVYNAAGTMIHTFPFPADVANGANQNSVMIGNSATTVAPDFPDPALDIPAAGGAVCFDAPDCVTWGNFTGTLPNAQSANAMAITGIPAGKSLTRSIAPGDPNLLQDADDTNNSANDFLVCDPTPRNNGGGTAPDPTAPSCTSAVESPPPPPAPETPPTDPPPPDPIVLDMTPPETTIDKAPKKEIDTDKAKIAFSSNEAGSTFECKLDKGSYKDCTSPKTYRKLDDGDHKFLVRAEDPSRNVDPTPAKAKFEVDTG